MSDNSMYNILKGFDKVEKKTLKESTVTECGMGEMGPTSSPLSVNISGDAGDIASMLRMLSGMNDPAPKALTAIPMDNPDIPGRDDMPGDTDTKDGIAGGLAGAALGAKAGGIPGAIAGGYLGHKVQQAANKKPEPDDEMEEWDNEPEEEYSDHDMMINQLSGGINRKKKAYAAAQSGDNAMAVESIKARLYKALEEAKAKPDFLDVDKDGDKKEPMKKALKDKGSKPKKGQVPPQFKKK
jgi:hypothetical protein